MPINSRQKGAAGEREWASWLREALGVEARRGQQFSGSPDSPDVISSLEALHFEVKRVERLNLDKAMDQAVSDCADGSVPVVAHRRNRKPWMVTIRADDIPQFILAMEEAICRKESPPSG